MADDPRVAALVASAQRLGANPVDLATVISYETGGTFNPGIRGGAGNRHVGLIQFGPNEQQAYGASQGQSFEDQLPAVEGYLTDRGFKPGMGRLDLYSTINAGRPGRYTASDAGNGGAPGTVADKVAGQMGAHEAKAAAFLGGTFSPGSASPMGAFGLSGPVVAGTAGSTTPAGGAAMQAPQQAESGPSVAALLRALGSDGPTAAQVAPAQSAGPAPLALQPMQHRAQPFDAPDTSPRSRAPPAPEPPDNLTRPNPAPRGARAMPLAWGAHDRPHRLQRRPDLERSRRAPNQLPEGPARRDCEQLGARADGGPRLLAGRQPRLAPGHARRRRCLRADD